MVKYEYMCRQCGDIEETEFPMGTAPSTIGECLRCDSTVMHRLFSPVAVSFKGSGFYRTDNRKTKRVRASAKVGGNQ